MFTTTCNQTIKVNISLVSAVRLQEDNRVTLDVTISGWWPGITQVPAVVRLQEDNSTWLWCTCRGRRRGSQVCVSNIFPLLHSCSYILHHLPG